MLVKGTFIGPMSGKLNGLVASHNRGGPYFREHVIPTDPRTTQQMICRDAFGAARATWVAMTEDERHAWIEYAQTISTLNRMGDRHTMTPFDAFTQRFLPSYQRVQALDLAGTFNTEPPLGPANDFEFMRVTAPDTTHLTFTWGPDPMTWQASPEQDGFIVHVSAPYSPTRYWFRGPFKPAIWAEGDSDTPRTTPWTLDLPADFQGTSGQILFVRVRLLNAFVAHGRTWQSRVVIP